MFSTSCCVEAHNAPNVFSRHPLEHELLSTPCTRFSDPWWTWLSSPFHHQVDVSTSLRSLFDEAIPDTENVISYAPSYFAKLKAIVDSATIQ